MKPKLEDVLDGIIEEDPRYKMEAYEFVLDALHYTQKKFQRTKHVTGKELLEGIKILLMEHFGPMTLTVLNYWGVNATEDFGVELDVFPERLFFLFGPVVNKLIYPRQDFFGKGINHSYFELNQNKPT